MGQSPAPVKYIQAVGFSEIVDGLLDGKHYARKGWKEPAEIYMRNDLLKIKRDGTEHDLILSGGDLASEDWYII